VTKAHSKESLRARSRFIIEREKRLEKKRARAVKENVAQCHFCVPVVFIFSRGGIARGEGGGDIIIVSEDERK
jgi:hypothetical protein